MTDHRPTDLGYGHPGKATYDTEERQWVFSINRLGEQNIQQISAFEEYVPPSIKSLPPNNGKRSDLPKNKLNKFMKGCPENFPANEVLSSLMKYEPKLEAETPTHFGTLLAIGGIYVQDKKRRSQIIALPCGEAGHILKIIRVQTRNRSWGDRKAREGPTIQYQFPHQFDQGYWMGTGGTIRQVVFSGDENEATSWLAVRQDSVTTIFRPSHGEAQNTPVQGSPLKVFRASPLQANPIVSLSIRKTGMQNHVDVSFNPWYSRQFIVVDMDGNWSIWDIENSKKGFKLVSGKSGNVSDGQEPDPLPKSSILDEDDGWHCACWVSDLATIAVCNRRTVAIFNIKAEPARLHSIDFSKSFSERIIDVKRSLTAQNHLFVLTSSQIFLIDITPAGEGDQDYTGAKIVLSYRHFRNTNDGTLRLVALQDDYASVVISSSQTPLLNIYAFRTAPGAKQTISWQRSFILSKNTSSQSLDTLCFVPAAFDAGDDSDLAGLEDVFRFYQVWALTSQLALTSTVCVAHDAGLDHSKIPSFWKDVALNRRKSTRFSKVVSAKVVSKPFIIKDHEDEENLEFINPSSIPQVPHELVLRQKQEDLRLRINWGMVFDRIYSNNIISKAASPIPSQNETGTLEMLLKTLWDEFHRAKQTGGITMSTLFEMTGQTTFSEGLDRATNDLHGLIQEFKETDDPEDEYRLAISNLTHCPSMDSLASVNREEDISNFLWIYDRLTDGWMSSLPEKVSNASRLSKYKTIRRVAIELCLSSIGVSLTAEEPSLPKHPEAEDQHLLSPEMSPEPSQSTYQTLPTNRTFRTPSIYSRTTTAISEPTEDPAITRLRRYAISIDTQPDLGKSRLLSHWVVGGNPAEYSWVAAENNAAAESGDENSRKKRREDTRRRRLTEKFLMRERSERSTTVGTESQRSVVEVPRGSQPTVGGQMFSSQPVVEIPMTQPVGGAFGSRSATKGKGKKKKVRKTGF
ncbi:hypothetical protein HYFRA_00000682 [Hymenoscyphus fraxineus]|uniref:RNA polymerase I-specific transcription initiation factor RRN6-like protein n=1 Tax=Hymenoscyphus fraxineus TaxID=746836 RepID=A0A9N9PSR0_9HELO|nr:hypothetical protein HYFRA_00000682 [Hymenoscyphus fraxineus]